MARWYGVTAVRWWCAQTEMIESTEVLDLVPPVTIDDAEYAANTTRKGKRSKQSQAELRAIEVNRNPRPPARPPFPAFFRAFSPGHRSSFSIPMPPPPHHPPPTAIAPPPPPPPRQ